MVFTVLILNCVPHIDYLGTRGHSKCTHVWPHICSFFSQKIIIRIISKSTKGKRYVSDVINMTRMYFTNDGMMGKNVCFINVLYLATKKFSKSFFKTYIITLLGEGNTTEFVLFFSSSRVHGFHSCIGRSLTDLKTNTKLVILFRMIQ